MVTRRLDAEERLALKTGCVYAWEERGPHTEVTGLGIERFTEGRRWSPSRVRDEFLFYYEKYCPAPDIGGATEKQQSGDWDPLVKQTYSVWIETDNGRRKWHLTAYFTQATVNDLGTTDDIPAIQDLVVPPGLFKSTRVGKHRGRGDEQTPRTSEASTRTSATVTRTYAPFPSLHNHYSLQSKSSESVMMYEPYENANSPGYSYAHDPSPRYSAAASAPDHDRNSLPPIRSYFDAGHGVAAPSSAQGHPTSSHSRQSTVNPVTDSPAHSQGESKPTTPCISAHPTSHRPALNHQSTAAYSGPTQSRRSPSPAAFTHADDTYTDRSTSFYFPSESPPRYTDWPTHGPSTTYSHSPDVGSPDQPRLGNSTDSGPPNRHEYHMSTSQPNPPHCPLPPLRIDPFPPSYELLPTTEPSHLEGRRGSIGPDRDLAPIYTLTRPHPYRRNPLDDRALRLLSPRTS